MGNQNGKPEDRGIDGKFARSPARTKLIDVTASAENQAGEKAVEGTSAAVEVAETEPPIDKYQVVETPKDITLEISAMATEVESSTLSDQEEKVEANEKSSYIDVAEVNEATKDDAKSLLLSKSEEKVDLENESAETTTRDGKPSNVSAGEKELLLGKGTVSGELSESAMSTTPVKMKRLSQSLSFFKNCLFCIPNDTS